MKMTDSEALGFIGALLMRAMGVLLVIADELPMDGPRRDYIMRQRAWYEWQQDILEIGEMVDEAMGDAE